jgi:hypothetical protein
MKVVINYLDEQKTSFATAAITNNNKLLSDSLRGRSICQHGSDLTFFDI